VRRAVIHRDAVLWQAGCNALRQWHWQAPEHVHEWDYGGCVPSNLRGFATFSPISWLLGTQLTHFDTDNRFVNSNFVLKNQLHFQFLIILNRMGPVH
jgi:hypothetical protein